MASDLSTPESSVEPPEAVRGSSVPYMSFQGFRTLLDRLHANGVPQVFDRSWFGQNQSGSLTAQIRGTLRFFDLLDEEKRPTPKLQELVSADEPERIKILREIAETKYADAIGLGTNATQGQLADTFRARGLSGESITKAITFYVALTEYLSLPTSPFYKQARVSNSAGNGGSPRRTSRRRKPSVPQEPPPPLRVDQPAVPPLEVKKTEYIDLLMKLAEGSSDKGEVQKDLLDRLERALGYGPTAANQRRGQ